MKGPSMFPVVTSGGHCGERAATGQEAEGAWPRRAGGGVRQGPLRRKRGGHRRWAGLVWRRGEGSVLDSGETSSVLAMSGGCGEVPRGKGVSNQAS